jgi:hypothetical protein
MSAPACATSGRLRRPSADARLGRISSVSSSRLLAIAVGKMSVQSQISARARSAFSFAVGERQLMTTMRDKQRSAQSRQAAQRTGTHLHHDAVYSRATVSSMGKRARRRAAETAPTRRSPKAPGARVARVAVDDATWEAFRTACAPVPASVRLGQLVAADVLRAQSDDSKDPRAELRKVRERLDALEWMLPP